MDELRSSFRPEFLNRLDEIICFKPLNRNNISSIVGLLVKDINRRLADRELAVELTDEACAFVAENGFDPVYGARPLKRYIQRSVETISARIILEGRATEGSTITIDAVDGKLVGRV